MTCDYAGIASLDLSFWKEDPARLPQQFNSESLYPQLKESLAVPADLLEEEDDGFVAESPTRPGFPQPGVNSGAAGEQLQFVSEEDDIQDVFRKPAIGERG